MFDPKEFKRRTKRIQQKDRHVKRRIERDDSVKPRKKNHRDLE
jgi:hypothetical protein